MKRSEMEMTNREYVTLLAEVLAIKEQLRILDPRNTIENKSINFLKYRLKDILYKVEIIE